MATRLQWWRDRLRDPEWMLALATIALGVIAFTFYFTILWISMPVVTGYIGPALRGLRYSEGRKCRSTAVCNELDFWHYQRSV